MSSYLLVTLKVLFFSVIQFLNQTIHTNLNQTWIQQPASSQASVTHGDTASGHLLPMIWAMLTNLSSSSSRAWRQCWKQPPLKQSALEHGPQCHIMHSKHQQCYPILTLYIDIHNSSSAFSLLKSYLLLLTTCYQRFHTLVKIS